MRPASEFLGHHKAASTYAVSRTESSQEHLKNLSAGRSYFEQIKLKSSHQNCRSNELKNGRRTEERPKLEIRVPIPPDHTKQDKQASIPTNQEQHNPPLMITEDESKK